VETEKRIIAALGAIGIGELRSGIAGHGVTAMIRGQAPGRCLALRADCDGLPIREETGLPFASRNGCAHACGHDAHMAMLLGAAQILYQNRSDLKGTVKLIFQSYEEGAQGALAMIRDGALKNPAPDAVAGLHTGSLFKEIPAGSFGYRPGQLNASATEFAVTFMGRGGHASAPHLTVDPIMMAAQAVIQLEIMAGRELPSGSGILSVTRLEGGSAHNIIPESCQIQGTVRALSPESDAYFHERLEKICAGIAENGRGSARLEYIYHCPAVVSDSGLCETLRRVLTALYGEEAAVLIPAPAMFGEDVSQYMQSIPGVYFFHSSIFGDDRDYPHHHPKFTVNEEVLWRGAAALAGFATEWQRT
jgi:amidohydrolase